MALIETSMDVANVPDADIKYGAREFIQNWRDAIVEFGASGTVEWRKSTTSKTGGRLHIENTGCTLPRSALRTGHTSKAGRDDMIGHFGHGFKEGCVVMVRNNRAVIVRTGPEVWRPTIAHSATFGGPVLAFQIQTGRKNENRVTVEIEVSREEWDSMKDDFLFDGIGRRTLDDRIEVPSGALLTAPRFEGKVYVKGIFVAAVPGLTYGYDLRYGKTDRERKIAVDVEKYTRQVLSEAIDKVPALFDGFYRLLAKGAEDVRGIGEYDGSVVEPAVRAMIRAEFEKKHGEDAVPVPDESDAREISALGKKGVVVSRALCGILTAEYGDVYSIKRKLREEVLETHSVDTLTEEESAVYVRVLRLLDGSGIDASSIDVVTFRDKRRQGAPKDGRILVARSSLESVSSALRVLVREGSRLLFTDVDGSYERAAERVWSGIVERLAAPPVASTSLVHVPRDTVSVA